MQEADDSCLTDDDKKSFVLSSKYILYAMNRLDWMYEFVDEAEKYGIDIKYISNSMQKKIDKKSPIGSKIPELRLINGGKNKKEKK